MLFTVLSKVNPSILKFASQTPYQLTSVFLCDQIRQSSFRSSRPVLSTEEYPNVEIEKNPTEWKYVEMCLAKEIIPVPNLKMEYPSGWKPQTIKPNDVPYFITRTKNHMLPIYLNVSFRGLRRVTILKRINGNIWELERDLCQLVERSMGKKIATRINELSGQIWFHGDYVNLIHDYLLKKGF